MTVPSPTDHLEQARLNRDHAEWLITTSPSDPTACQWAVVATFYSALHALTAVLLAKGVAVKSHSARGRALQSAGNGIPIAIVDAYRALEDESRGARYELWSYSMNDVRDLLDNELADIAAFTGL